MILVVDYGMSNLRSVAKALENLGASVLVSGDPKDLEKADKVVLPGVGAFGDAARELEKRALKEPLKDYVRSGRPFLGVCLGLQLLFQSSDESPKAEGLGILPGRVVRFSDQLSLKVPHMGWNQIRVTKTGCQLVEGMPDGSFFYFVHSYYVKPDKADVTLAVCDYGGDFTAMVWRENLYGTQFHPEKSQEAGLKLLANFLRL